MLGLLAGAEASAQPAGLNEYLCLRGAPTRQSDRALRFVPRNALAVRDRLTPGASPAKLDLRKSLGLCLPAGTPPGDAATHLEVYGARLSRTRPAQPRPPADLYQVSNRFGTDALRVKGIEEVLVPSAALFDPPPAPSSVAGTVDAFTCYAAERAAGLRGQPVAPAPITVATTLGTLQWDVKAPLRVCFPSDLAGSAPDAPARAGVLACYRAKLTRTRPPQASPFPRRVATINGFGSERLTLTAPLELCVPSEARGVNATPTPQRTAVPSPTPTLTPPPGFTLRVAPAEVTVDIGASARFTATAVFLNGDTQDFTERVLWRSSSAAGAAANEPGDRGRIDAVDAGATVVSVLDAATGVTSTASGEDAILTVSWTLERIELLPTAITRGRGESVRLRATGHFAGGFTRSIAERLVYASSAPGIAAPTNAAAVADHSRVLAVAEGNAVLSATDPLSGLTSSASGDDVAMTVVPPLARCTILQTAVALATDTTFQLTAHGFYPGGFQRVVTQQVQWTSDDPEVVAAANPEGNRSRIDALAPGQARITATDPITDVACEGTATITVGDPTSLFLQPPSPLSFGPIRVPRSWQAVAVERFPPPIGKKYVTEQVVFTSSDPAIVAAPNVAGNRGRLDAVASGTATITATDPASGLVSQAIHLRALDGLTRVVLPVRSAGWFSVVDVGATAFIHAVGEFADGPATLEGADVTFVSDNPAVIATSPAGPYWRIEALAPGQATVSAIDKLTGISSDAFGDSLRIGVRGAVERVVVIPQQLKRRVGEAYPFSAVVHYAGGASEIVPLGLQYTSSDPAVAVVANAFFVNRVDAVGGGVTTITATDPVSGVASADSGDSATLTVVGPLTGVRVQPSFVTRSRGRAFAFTAIGSDAAGREINVTQDVAWSSSDSVVAAAPNVEGNRSRVLAQNLGTATIAAFDAQDGVSSTSSGDDASFEVKGILSTIVLSVERNQLFVGEVIRLTAIGRLFGSSAPINLTQEVEYTSSNPSVVKAENTPGDRSRLVALQPGLAVISAYDPGTGITTNSNGKVTIAVTAP